MPTMKKSFLLSLFLMTYIVSFSQNIVEIYSGFIHKADSFYAAGKYKEAGDAYSSAFKANGWKGMANDRYNAACAWARANVPDSAFFNLNRIVTKMNYVDYAHLSIDPDFKSLYDDKRWNPLLGLVKANKEKAEENLNKPLAHQLDSIYEEDQKYRMQIDETEKKFGLKSVEMKALWKTIREKDSVDLIKVENILDRYGWLGQETVGKSGNAALFLVIQHCSDMAVRDKYLPMMRDAVKNGKASGSELALLEDRTALGHGRRQIYGSQISRNTETLVYYVSPLEDPDHVDQRRAEVGLPPLAEYVNNWNIKWDVETYKKELPLIEAREKSGKQ